MFPTGKFCVQLLFAISCWEFAFSVSDSENGFGEMYKRQDRGFFDWLFGPPVKPNSSITQSPTPLIRHQIFHINGLEDGKHPTTVAAGPPAPDADTTANQSNAEQIVILTPKPRVLEEQLAFPNTHRVIESNSTQNLDFDPDQARRKRDVDVEEIDPSKKNLTPNISQRNRREEGKFRQLNIPYGNAIASSNNRINSLSKRQLLLSPAEQQMLILQQQQQELAAAQMLQQYPRYNRYNRYNNRYIDDYYDDDSSYEDSDEYDNFNRYGVNPIFQAMRHRIVGPPTLPNHPYGIGRRSLPDQVDGAGKRKNKAVPLNMKKINGERKGLFKASLPEPFKIKGWWDTIEDYDVNSDFNKVKGGRLEDGNDFEDVTAPHHLDDDAVGEKLRSINVGRWRATPTEMRNSNLSFQNVSTSSPVSNHNETGTDNENIFSAEESSTLSFEQSNEEDLLTTKPNNGEAGLETSSTDAPDVHDVSTTEIHSTTTIKSESTSGVDTDESPASPTTTVENSGSKIPPYHQTLNCRCGMQSVRGHDNGDGTIIRTNINPWLVSVRSKRKHLCSGSIINNKYILTSKTCVHGLKGLLITAGLGSGIPKNFSVIRVSEHKTRDIAILKVRPAIRPNFAMRPICLPIDNVHEEGNEHRTGILVTFKKSNAELQLVHSEIPMLEKRDCKNGGRKSDPGSICPGPPASMKCGGDTGGVLQVYHEGYSYQQIGVVSSSVGCRANNTSGVYSDVKKSVKWILFNTRDARYCSKPKTRLQGLQDDRHSEVKPSPFVKNVETEDERDDPEFGDTD